jgi:hypothetical protein
MLEKISRSELLAIGCTGMSLPQALELISNAVHLSIDMQNLFAPGGIWANLDGAGAAGDRRSSGA